MPASKLLRKREAAAAGIELLHRIRKGQFTLGRLGVQGRAAPEVWNAVLQARSLHGEARSAGSRRLFAPEPRPRQITTRESCFRKLGGQCRVGFATGTEFDNCRQLPASEDAGQHHLVDLTLAHLRQLADVAAGLSDVVRPSRVCWITASSRRLISLDTFAVRERARPRCGMKPFREPLRSCRRAKARAVGEVRSAQAATLNYSVNSQNRATNRLEHMWTLSMNWSAVPHWSCAGPGSTGSP
jgi:hypothetical protein